MRRGVIDPTDDTGTGKLSREKEMGAKAGRTLVPLDGSSLAEAVIPYVKQVARGFSSPVTLFHVSNACEGQPDKASSGLDRGRGGGLCPRNVAVRVTLKVKQRKVKQGRMN